MNIVERLIKKFFIEEKTNNILVLVISLITSALKINGTSFITSNIIQSVQEKNIKGANHFFYYFVCISILFLIFDYSDKHIQNILFTKLSPWLRQELLRFIMYYNNEEFKAVNFVKANPSINRMTTSLYIIYYDILTKFIPNITFLLVVSSYFIYKNFIFGLSFFLANMLIIAYFVVQWTSISELRMENEINLNVNEKYMMDLLNNMEKIVYRGKIQDEMSIFEEKTKTVIDQSIGFYATMDTHLFIMEMITYFIIFASMGYIIKLNFNKQLDTITTVTFITILLLYRGKANNCIENLVSYVEFVSRTNYVINEFVELIGEFKEIETKEYKPVDLPFHSIVFENVTFKFPISENYIYQDLNLSFNTTDSIIGITGLSGKGKSTMMKLILKLYKPLDGRILIDGQDIQEVDTNYIRKNITYVNQNSKMFDQSIISNILYGCSDKDACNGHLDEILKYPKIKELYKNIDIHESSMKNVNERLSGGQRQIINILCGLVNPCKILILDEPTTGLDADLKQEILSLIKHFKQYKQSIIIITHDADVYPLFNEKVDI
jgi:ABC-type multidrug transport system fused ATPase/permease subunit